MGDSPATFVHELRASSKPVIVTLLALGLGCLWLADSDPDPSHWVLPVLLEDRRTTPAFGAGAG